MFFMFHSDQLTQLCCNDVSIVKRKADKRRECRQSMCELKVVIFCKCNDVSEERLGWTVGFPFLINATDCGALLLRLFLKPFIVSFG